MKKELTQRQAGKLTGISIIIIAVVAGAIVPTIFEPLFSSEPPNVDITSSFKTSHLLGLIGWVIIFLVELAASYGLYQFYRPKNNRKALLMGALRLVYTLVLGVAIFELVQANTQLNSSNPDLKSFLSEVLSFQKIWYLGLIVFGFHLLLLSQLVCGKKILLKVFSTLLFISGVGYIGNNLADFVVEDFHLYRAKIEAFFLLPMILGELSLAIWLLVKGGKKSVITDSLEQPVVS